MASHPSPKRAVENPTIPDRLYFKIGDVARILKVEPYVLRFWESQFPQLKPNKSGTGQRLYRKRDVEIAVEIKRLVYGEGYTLSGARQALGQARRAEPQAAAAAPAKAANVAKKGDKVAEVIGRARAELREIAGILASPAKDATATVQPFRRKSRPSTAENASGSLFDA
ncbi:MAG: MerR family transcriptional regulator [Terracidiphilus sp.]